MKTFRVGLIYFQEAFSKDLQYNLSCQKTVINSDGEEVQIISEHISISEYNLDMKSNYDLILDRASHYFKLALSQFMMYAHQGTRIVNNPLSFHYFMERKDMGYYIAHQLGVNVPPTYVLPTCKTPHFENEDFIHHQHFNWEKIIEEIGFPCFLKPANGRGARNVHHCRNRMELMTAYEGSGSEIMTLQSKVDSPHEWQIRCICLGKEILVCKYIFRDMDQSEYIVDDNFLSEESKQSIIDQTKVINRCMGYEMNSVEFFLDQEGIPWAIDFNNPIPDGRLEALGEFWYKKYQKATVQLILDAAYENKPSNFIPEEINEYAKIAQMDCSKKEKFKIALKKANLYYEK
ncbi:MAG: hypothetical protein COB02_04125 [Candidatus Cloacimonadota bacterium]|nr:MAG: hypothetical protein COB02_04125 [Candidatus Cloacimonadota bacterium]